MDDSLTEWVIQRIAQRLPEEEADSAPRLAELAGAYFCERTGRRNIPIRAAVLWADIALAMRTAETGAAEAGGHVSMIKRGDTTVQYDGQDGPQLGLNALEARLARFRAGRLI